MRLVFFVMLTIAVTACEPYDHVVVDEGRVCVQPAEVERFAAGDALELTVRLHDCISACAEDAEATCTAVRRGDLIEVASEGHWNEPRQICIAVCASLQATCTLEDVPPGDYTIAHGDVTHTLTLPSTLDTACL